MITVPRRPKHPSRGARRPSDIAVSPNINAEFNLMAVNPIIGWFSTDLIPEYCHDFDSSAVYTPPPFSVEYVPGLLNRNLPRPPWHMHAEEIIPTFLRLNIDIKLCLPKDCTLTRLML